MKAVPFVVAFSVLILLGAGCVDAKPSSSGNEKTASLENPVPASKRLDLSGTGLEKVPSSVFSKTDLEELDLSENRLTGALPGEIRHLSRLRVLKAGGNAMTGVPAEIGQMSALQTLDLSNNRLTGLPMELGNLKNLRTLDLRGNDVSKTDLDEIRKKLTSTNILAD